MAALARLEDTGSHGAATRLHILASVWTVPLAWFAPFSATERWLSLGPGQGRASARATAPAMRALVYTTPMSRARRRVARGLAALRGMPTGSGDTAWELSQAEGDLADVGRWLEEFHPYSLVELDYGGLVHLVSDDALCGDQSVAEIRAAIDGQPAVSGSSPRPRICARTIGGARSRNSSWRTEWPADRRQILAGQLFPNLFLARCDDKYR